MEVAWVLLLFFGLPRGRGVSVVANLGRAPYACWGMMADARHNSARGDEG